MGCDPVRLNDGDLTLPKRFRMDGLLLGLGESVDADPELWIDDLEMLLALDSFLFFRWPTVSLVGSDQETSNILKEPEEVRSAEWRCRTAMKGGPGKQYWTM